MNTPVRIAFHDLGPSDAITMRIRQKAEKLERFFPRIISMSVLVEPSAKRHRHGTPYHVRVQLHVPGAEIVAGNDPGNDDAHQDVYVAIRDSFRAARRQLEDYVRLHFRSKRGWKNLVNY